MSRLIWDSDAINAITPIFNEEGRRGRMTIRLIDARRGLKRKCKELFGDEKIAEQIYRYLCDGIEECEDADTEIIRCKDCKHCSPNGKYGCKAYHYKLYELHEMCADDFCSRAERRTE